MISDGVFSESNDSLVFTNENSGIRRPRSMSRKRWIKLQNVFRSINLLKKHQVKTIDDPVSNKILTQTRMILLKKLGSILNERTLEATSVIHLW
jgi:hypothetical protein